MRNAVLQRAQAAYTPGATALVLALAGITIALGFQYIGGYVPCMLCLIERYAYYAGIPLLFAALTLYSSGLRGWASVLFFLVSLAFLANAGLGVYHAGAEWKLWPGPASCGGDNAIATSTGALLKDLETIHIVKCDEAPFYFLGLSFAGWNAVASLLIMAFALKAAFASRSDS